MSAVIPSVSAPSPLPGVDLQFRARQPLLINGEQVASGTILTSAHKAALGKRKLQTLLNIRRIVMVPWEEAVQMTQKAAPAPVLSAKPQITSSKTKPKARR